jgi:hypothetical protein
VTVAEAEKEEEDCAGGSNSLPIMLGNNRRADKSEFRGKTYINIREYYEVKPAPMQGYKIYCEGDFLNLLWQGRFLAKDVLDLRVKGSKERRLTSILC